MIARIKGLKISQVSERTAVTGQEMIPFQDGERNGKIRMIEFKDMTMYIFDPTIIDGKVSQEDYDALKQAIEEGKLIYTINSNRNGLDLATEVAIVGGTIYIESPDFIKEEGTDNISQVVFDTITVDGSLNYNKEQYTTTVIKTTGDGTKVLTDNGQYVYIGNLALTNIKFKDGTNTSTYDLVTNGITFRQNSTPCVSWNTIKSGNNIYMDIRIANATASMDGLMSKEDYVELNTTIPGQIEDLKEADSNINNRIDDLDDKIDKEIADREAEIDRIENKFDGVTDKLEDALQKEIEDRKAGDTTITNSLNAFISTKGQPSGLAELDSTGKVPAAQLPSYVDDVLEFSTKAQFPQTGETGKIYVAKDTNLTYRWTGTQYLEISQSLALGETPSTAYPGDKGKTNRDALNSMPTKITSYLTPTTSTGELVKINYKYAAKDGLNYGPLQDDNIDIPSATTTNAGAMSAIDKGRLDDLYNEFGSIQNPGDKLDSLPNNLVTGVDATSRNATSVTINYKQSDLSAASNSYANPITKSQTIPAATQSAAGVMTATDKVNLDVNLPAAIAQEVQDRKDAIEALGDAQEAALNKEIQDRKDADTALDNKFTSITNDHEERLVAEEGTSDALPDTMVTDVSAVTRNATQLTFKVKTSTKDQENNQYGADVESTKNLLPVTQTLAGVMSAADKVKLDGLDPNAITEISAASDADKVTVTVTKDNGLNDDTTENFDLPAVSSTKAGTMTAKDKVELDRIRTVNFALGSVTPDATNVVIDAAKTNVEDGTERRNPISLPPATQTKAGVMTATDKQNLDVNIPNRITNLDNRVTTEVDRLEELIESSSSEITNDLNVEIQARKDGDNQLQTNINNLQSTMNTELAKKVGKVTVAGSGNAVTTASISGDTLTLTKGATYNNYVHPAGSAPSKASGFYKFSTDSTSHVASVTAVTKADITALGIPAQNANTTYTFANGSTGNFTVTPSGGTAQTVSVGKPANAGNADTVGGISPSAFVKKAGDTMTGTLTINQTSSTIPLTLIGKNEASYVQFNTGEDSAEVGFHTSLGAYLLNDKLATHPSISLGRVDSLDEGATFYYRGTHYKLLHKGNYANELDQRYLPKIVYDYRNGCLVRLRNSASDSTMITVRIFGNSYYGNSVPFDTVIQFYNYPPENKIFQATGVNNGYSFGDIKVFNYDNRIYLWFKQPQQYETFMVHAYHNGDLRNMVESITNAAMPTSGVTRTVTITPKQAIYSYDNIAVGNVTSSGKVSAAGGFFKESDARLKSDIKPLDYTLEQICSIPTVSFIMNDQKQIGTIAQNLEELGFEDIVTESDTLKSEVKNPEQFESFTKDGEEYVKVKKVEYEMLGVLAIEGVKMLKDEIEKLKAEIETLKNKQHE